jgi:ABC-2 type transport system permease protein
VFGIIVIALFAKNALLALGLSLLVTFLWASVILLSTSLPFYLERSSRLSQNIRAVAVGFSSWPVNVYRPLVRMMLFVTLLAFLGAYPAELVREFTWRGFGTLLGAIAIGVTASLIFFYRGLRRYESGNLVGCADNDQKYTKLLI